MAYQSERSRHTAPFLLSYFLNSKASLELTWLTPTFIAILRYIYDAIEMAYGRTNNTTCRISIDQISTYSRAHRTTVMKALKYFEKYKLLAVSNKKHRSLSTYAIGEFLALRTPYPLNDRKSDQNIIHNNPQTLVDKSPVQSNVIVQKMDLRSLDATQKTSFRSPEATHLRKSNNKNQERESRDVKRPLSLADFSANEKHKDLARQLGVNFDQELDSFKNRHRGSGNLDYEFDRWIKGAADYMKRKATLTAMKATRKPFVEESRRPRGEDWTKTRSNETQSIGSILGGIAPPPRVSPIFLAAQAEKEESIRRMRLLTVREQVKFHKEGTLQERLNDAARGDFSWRENSPTDKGTSLSG